jgi:hypothetical protein
MAETESRNPSEARRQMPEASSLQHRRNIREGKEKGEGGEKERW